MSDVLAGHGGSCQAVQAVQEVQVVRVRPSVRPSVKKQKREQVITRAPDGLLRR